MRSLFADDKYKVYRSLSCATLHYILHRIGSESSARVRSDNVHRPQLNISDVGCVLSTTSKGHRSSESQFSPEIWDKSNENSSIGRGRLPRACNRDGIGIYRALVWQLRSSKNCSTTFSCSATRSGESLNLKLGFDLKLLSAVCGRENDQRLSYMSDQSWVMSSFVGRSKLIFSSLACR